MHVLLLLKARVGFSLLHLKLAVMGINSGVNNRNDYRLLQYLIISQDVLINVKRVLSMIY